MRISDWSSDVCSSDLDEVLVGRQAERAAVDAGNVPQTIHQLAYKTAILNEQRKVMTTIRCLRPTIAIAIGFEAERTGGRSEGRRLGKEGGSTSRYRWSPYHSKTNTTKYEKKQR